MTEQTEIPAEIERPTREIPFRDRSFMLRMPTPEQLLVWQRTVKQLQGADTASWDGNEVMRALERARKIIDSLLSDPRDIEWLDDEMLAGNLGLREVAPIILDALKAFQDGADEKTDPVNREERRAVKKATRKKASK